MVDVPTLSIVVAAASVVAGVVYYAFQLRHSVKARQMDLLMRLYLTWGSEDMKKAFQKVIALEFMDFDDFVKKYGSFSPEPSPVSVSVDRVAWFMNGIGFLVHKKLVDIESVDELFGHGIIWLWEKLKPIIEGWRKRLGTPKSNMWFEYLDNEMKKREQRPQQIQQ